jgi:hypothetical protein
VENDSSLHGQCDPPKQASHIELRLTPDPRLLPGVMAAVAHFADRAGLDPAAQADLSAAAEQAFRAAFALLDEKSARLTVRIEDFPDRVEVVFEHQGHPWDAAVEKMFAKVNRVRRESSGKLSRLVLIEYVAPSTRQ